MYEMACPDAPGTEAMQYTCFKQIVQYGVPSRACTVTPSVAPVPHIALIQPTVPDMLDENVPFRRRPRRHEVEVTRHFAARPVATADRGQVRCGHVHNIVMGPPPGRPLVVVQERALVRRVACVIPATRQGQGSAWPEWRGAFVWPRHANGMLSTTPLDPCACEMSAQ